MANNDKLSSNYKSNLRSALQRIEKDNVFRDDQEITFYLEILETVDDNDDALKLIYAMLKLKYAMSNYSCDQSADRITIARCLQEVNKCFEANKSSHQKDINTAKLLIKISKACIILGLAVPTAIIFSLGALAPGLASLVFITCAIPAALSISILAFCCIKNKYIYRKELNFFELSSAAENISNKTIQNYPILQLESKCGSEIEMVCLGNSQTPAL